MEKVAFKLKLKEKSQKDEYKKRHEDLADQNCVVLVIQCGVDDDS